MMALPIGFFQRPWIGTRDGSRVAKTKSIVKAAGENMALHSSVQFTGGWPLKKIAVLGHDFRDVGYYFEAIVGQTIRAQRLLWEAVISRFGWLTMALYRPL